MDAKNKAEALHSLGRYFMKSWKLYWAPLTWLFRQRLNKCKQKSKSLIILMFVAHPGAEPRGRLKFGDGTKQWAIIEQELSIPWLYVCITQIDHYYDHQRMLLVSCVEYFVKLLDELPENASVTSVMSALPNREGINLWSMVPAERIRTSIKDGRSVATVTFTNDEEYE